MDKKTEHRLIGVIASVSLGVLGYMLYSCGISVGKCEELIDATKRASNIVGKSKNNT